VVNPKLHKQKERNSEKKENKREKGRKKKITELCTPASNSLGLGSDLE
jgi:hypothetical protein